MIKNKTIPGFNTTNNSLFPLKNKDREKLFAVSFSGVGNNADFFSTKLHYKEICSKDRFKAILNMFDPSYKEHFEGILSDLKEEVSKNPHLFRDMPEDVKTKIQNDDIIGLPEKGFMGRFLDAISDPITGSLKLIKNKFAGKEKLSELRKEEQIRTGIANLEGLIEYVETLKGKSPEEVKKLIREKIKKNFSKIKAGYSSNLSSTLTEMASLLVAAGFHGCDFYNITRRADDNHKEAMKEAKIKVKQDGIRLVVLSYLTYVVATLFKKDCNKSMGRMLAIASLIQLAAEIINRKMTGRPILPLNNKTLKKYQEKEEQKAEKAKNKKISFTGSPVKGFFSKELIYSKDELKNIITLTERVDSEQAKRFVNLIEEKLSGDLKGKRLESIYSDDKIKDISLGKKESTFEKVVKCIFIPVTALARLIKKLASKGGDKTDEFIEVKDYFSFVKKLLKTKYKDKDLLKSEKDFKEFKKDLINVALGSFRATEANYNTANYSIIKRIFSYSIFTTFIAADAYNVTMIHSDGDKKKALIQAKQRIIQEITRFFISIYTASANLTLFGELYNKTLGNAFGLTVMTSTINNGLTRKVLGLPIGPKSKKQIQELDEKNKKSSFHRFTNKLIGKDT